VKWLTPRVGGNLSDTFRAGLERSIDALQFHVRDAGRRSQADVAAAKAIAPCSIKRWRFLQTLPICRKDWRTSLALL
jgi:hypothetical protein